MAPPDSNLPEFLQPYCDSLIRMQQLGEIFCQRGWNRATSGSYSVVVRRNPTELIITATRSAKSALRDTDFVLVDSGGKPIHQEQRNPSSRTNWHCTISENVSVGAVIHTHSIWTSVLASHFLPLGGVLLEGYEILKGLAGVDNPAVPVWLPILSDSSGTLPLAAQVQSALKASRSIYALIIHQQGLFTWGHDLEEAIRHTEVFEFLCEVIVRQSQLN